MNSALRGWRRKKRKNFEAFNRELDAFTKKINKRAVMNNVYGLSYGSLQLIHKGRKP